MSRYKDHAESRSVTLLSCFDLTVSHQNGTLGSILMIRRTAAYIILVSVYGLTWFMAVVGKIVPRRAWKPTGRIMVTGTFYNPNWYLSHVAPLSRSGVEEVIVVTDEPQMSLDRVRFVCWPGWLSWVLSRVGARALTMMAAGFRYRPDLYMGYHLGPGACTALIAGKLMGRPTCYQMTGGPVEIIGGGIYAAEGIGAPLGQPSHFIERMALAVVRQFDLIVVRGNKAKGFLATHGITRSVTVITGSVDNHLQQGPTDRDIDLVFVGRLSPIKQIDQFIAIVGVLARTMKGVHAAIVGDGPLKAQLQDLAAQQGLTGNIDFLGQRKDVGALLARSKVFMLTSKSEGLSIAMAEAMSVGAVPVVADIGELGDLVVDGVNGYLVQPDNIDDYARKAASLLEDKARWSQYSCKAIEAARKHCDIDVVSEKWRQHLRDVVSQAPRCRSQEALS